jgi:ubiquinone/menaquinone biosynthesis C-methylase UbiE
VPSSWMIDQLEYAGPEHLNPGYVSGYDRKQGYPGVQDDLCELAALGVVDVESTVVDLGAGTGRFALAAAAMCRRVIAVDVSAAMLAHVRRTADESAVANLECVQAGFLDYEHRGSPADVVYTRNALHQLPDFWKGLALYKMARALRPGGVLVLHDLVYDFSPAEAPEVLEDWMTGAATDPAEGYTREDFATHVRTEFSTFSWLLQPLITHAGLRILSAEVSGRIYARYVCRKDATTDASA